MAVDTTALKSAIADWVNRGCEQGLAMLRDDINAPIGTADDPHQGMLRDSEQVLPISTVDVDGGEWRSSLAYTAAYASFTDEGSDPHTIEGNPLLAFNWPKVGKVMILHSVQHPGTQGTRWWSNSVNPDHWAEILQEAFDAIGPA